MPAQTVIKFRRSTAAQWTTANPILAAGEVGLETDTGLVKYGNGTLTWTALSYPSNSNITYLVRNNTASTILKGTLVAATGAEPSGRIDVAPFETTGLQDSELRIMGIATANISAGTNGTVMSFGTLTGLDTRGTAASGMAVGDEDWAAGTILYNHPTVPGKLTSVRPKHDLAIAFTTVRHATAGQISIRIFPGNFHLEWMHDVAISSPATGQILQYDGTDWVNADIEVPPGTTVSETAPVGPEEGQMWWDSSTGTLYIYYDSVWVEAVTGVVGPQGASGVVTATAPITYNSSTQTVGINQSGLTLAQSQITGLTTALDGKANTVHTHNMGQIITTVTDRASAYTIIAADENTFIRSTSGTAVTMTIANVLAIGESVQFIQFGAGQITFAAGAGVNLRSVDNKLKTNKQYSVAAITCVASAEYLVTGDLVA